MTVRSNSKHAVGEIGGADQRRVGRTDANIAAGSERRSSRHGVSTSLDGSDRRSNQRGVSTSIDVNGSLKVNSTHGMKT